MKATAISYALIEPILKALKSSDPRLLPAKGFVVTNVTGTLFVCGEMPAIYGRGKDSVTESWLFNESYSPVVSPKFNGEWVQTNVYGKVDGIGLELPKPLDTVIVYDYAKRKAFIFQISGDETWEAADAVITETLNNL